MFSYSSTSSRCLSQPAANKKRKMLGTSYYEAKRVPGVGVVISSTTDQIAPPLRSVLDQFEQFTQKEQTSSNKRKTSGDDVSALPKHKKRKMAEPDSSEIAHSETVPVAGNSTTEEIAPHLLSVLDQFEEWSQKDQNTNSKRKASVDADDVKKSHKRPCDRERLSPFLKQGLNSKLRQQ